MKLFYPLMAASSLDKHSYFSLSFPNFSSDLQFPVKCILHVFIPMGSVGSVPRQGIKRQTFWAKQKKH